MTRQYAVEYGHPKREIDYSSIQPVYTIIIIEKSSGKLAAEKACVHRFSQQSDTGVELELLQYYAYVCLDKFQENRPHIAAELQKWLDFLTITEMEDMITFLAENSSFQPLYDCAIMMYRDKKELMSMMTDIWENEDIVASLNKTNESIIKQKEATIKEKEATIKQLSEENQNKDAMLADKDAIIEELKRQLTNMV